MGECWSERETVTEYRLSLIHHLKKGGENNRNLLQLGLKSLRFNVKTFVQYKTIYDDMFDESKKLSKILVLINKINGRRVSLTSVLFLDSNIL